MSQNLDPIMLYNGHLITLKSDKHFFCVFNKITDSKKVYADKVNLATYGMPFENASWIPMDPENCDRIVNVLPFSLYFFILAINHKLFKVLSQIWQNISIIILVAFKKISLALATLLLANPTQLILRNTFYTKCSRVI